MNELKPVTGSLVLYKIRPARVLSVTDKIDIELEGGQTKRVRPKDIEVLHPGPLRTLGELTPCSGDMQEAWELLEGSATNLRELAELIYSEYSPATAWAAWQWVAEGLYFHGSPTAIQARPREEVERDRQAREAKETAKREWDEFIDRVADGRMEPQDRERLLEVERLALGETDQSRILQTLGHQETRENAYRLLVSVGYWAKDHNPYPGRYRVAVDEPDLPVPALPEEERLDLTHLPAYAIDDDGNRDPDDAISLDGDRIWVHVADVAALAPPDSPLDLEARARGSNLYAPERTVPMLPDGVTERLGLGLAEVSPALSFGFRYDDVQVTDLEVARSWVRVTRLSYEAADTRLDQEPFRGILAITERFREHRHARDAAAIELPEVSVRVVEGEVRIRSLPRVGRRSAVMDDPREAGGGCVLPSPRLRSRELVTDAMLMAGEAAARFALERGIPIPYASQDAPDQIQEPADLAAMWAYRRCFKPSRLGVEPSPHFGLGLDLYTRATSPLRRYSDLLVHQQLRAFLRGEAPLDAQQVAARVDLAESGSLAIRRAERLSNTHWKLVWLRAHPKWKGDGIVVDKGGAKVTVLIPELALDVKVRVPDEPKLNDRVPLALREIDLPDLTCWFRAGAPVPAGGRDETPAQVDG